MTVSVQFVILSPDSLSHIVPGQALRGLRRQVGGVRMVMLVAPRKRSVVIGTTAAVVVLVTTSLASATADDADTVTVCAAVSTGQLRMIAADETCRRGETRLELSRGNALVTREKLAADSVDSSKVIPDSLLAEDLATDSVGSDEIMPSAVGTSEIANSTVLAEHLQTDLLTSLVTENEFTTRLSDSGTPDTDVNERADAVSWFKLRDVPLGFADGADNVDGGTAIDVACTGCLTTDDLGDGSVQGAEIADGTITAAELDAGAVTLDKLASDVTDRFAAVESRATTLESRLDGLGTAPEAGDADRVSTTRLTGWNSVTVGVDPPSIAPWSRSAHIVPVTGLQLYDMVTVLPPPTLDDDLLFVGYDVVTRPNTDTADVVVYLYNNTTQHLDDVASTWNIRYLDLTP